MMLVDEGKVNVNDPVEKYLPEFKGQMLMDKSVTPPALRPPQHPITVKEILSHTGGMPFAAPTEKPTLDLHPLSEAVASYAKLPLLFEPGTGYEYSNAGINTVGRIIEVVSGMPYEQFMAERLFGPLGMTDTTFHPTAAQLQRLAKSYKADAAKTGLEETTITQLSYPLDDPKRQPIPAAGLFSTARDVTKFCQMMLGGGVYEGKRYLSEASLTEMTSKQTPDGPKVKQGGYGFSVFGGGVYGHDSAYKAKMYINPSKGLVELFMIQVSDFPTGGSACTDAFVKAAAALAPTP
jgi:CubicO group peptidase (beta-lactamase class C family)